MGTKGGDSVRWPSETLLKRLASSYLNLLNDKGKSLEESDLHHPKSQQLQLPPPNHK